MQSIQKRPETENPKRDTAVINTLAAVTRPVPNLLIAQFAFKLEIMVPAAIIIDTMPAYETGASRTGYMEGHAAPKRASGNPREINDK